MSYKPNLKQQDRRILNHISTSHYLARMIRQKRMNSILISIYVILVDTNNRSHWTHDFQCPTPTACELLGIHRNTWNRYVKQLIELGMIERVHSSKDSNEASWYTLMSPDFVSFTTKKFNKKPVLEGGGHAL